MPPVRRALTYDVDDRLERAENRTQNLRILLAQVFVQYDAEMAHQLLLLAGQHDHRDAGDEIGRLLAHFRRLVVEAPEHGTANLWAGKKTKNAFFFQDGYGFFASVFEKQQIALGDACVRREE